MPNANILPDQVIALARVMQFAKENGFPNASELFWDENNPEYGQPSLTELVEDHNVEYRVRLGIDLGAKPIIAVREWISDDGDDEITFRHNDQGHAPGEKGTAYE